ncbi:major facilitator superfamily transporter amine [Niveomyces insectorum RCEF 264]|uniref:Major facilitator superfamily transporter amine n=1 Tax=Niveomyces insectorum RCEF 264 TaxID=1081102 RepID=A0A167Q7B5_9HYPO|nr:major facilitator superfamily transporter amine [Niveomyces insectorum RCEF 264]
MSFRRSVRWLLRRSAAPEAHGSTRSGLPPPRSPPPVCLRFRSSTTFIVAAVAIAIFTDIFLYGLVVPVMPFALTARAGVAPDRVQNWNAILLACYSLALFLGSPVAGLYADRTASRRLPLLLGLVALAGATVLLCVGRTIGVFVAGRLLQGASAAVVWSVGLALLADTMGQRLRLAMGYVVIAMSMAQLFAPLVGGAVYANVGYNAVYYVAFGLLALDVVLRLLLVEKKVARRWRKNNSGSGSGSGADEEDAAGASAQPALLQPQGPVTQDAPAQAADADGDVGTDAHVARNTSPVSAVEAPADATDGQADGPPPPPESSPPGLRRRVRAHPAWLVLRSRRLMAALFGCVVQACILSGFDTVLPLFVQDTFAWTSTAAGLLFFALFVPPGLLSPLVGLLADRCGAKWPALVGFVATVPLLVCLRFVRANTTADKVLLGALLALLGVTLTLANVPLMAEIGFALEAAAAARPGLWGQAGVQGVYGIAYGLFTTAYALGGVAGSLFAGYLQADAGWATTVWGLAVWCGVGSVAVALWVGEFRVQWARKKGPEAAGEERTNGEDDAGTGTGENIVRVEGTEEPACPTEKAPPEDGPVSVNNVESGVPSHAAGKELVEHNRERQTPS